MRTAANWRTWAGLALLALAAPAFGKGKAAATVNGEAIPTTEVEALLALRPAELFPIPEAQQKLIRTEVLESLISERLMKQFLTKHGPAVDQAELNRQMSALIASLQAQGKSLAEFCKESRQSEAQLRAGIVIMLQYNAYARQQANDEVLKKYFQDNIDFFQKTTVRLSHIVIRIPLNSPPSEREIARQRLVELRQQIVAGKLSFADAARQYSQCPNASKGGDIGVVERKWMVDEAVAQTAFALKKDEVSDVVQSEFGLHLLKVTERTEGKRVEYAAVVDEVRDNYVEEMRQKLLLELRRTGRVEIHLR